MSNPGYTLPSEVATLRDTVRRFIANEVVPAEASLDPDATELQSDDLARLRALARQSGLWCVASPEEYGGAGLSIFSQAVVMEEAVQHRMGAYNPAGGAFGYDPPNVIFGGTPEQIARYAVPQIRDGTKAFFAITEPSGGADPAGAIQTRADPRDGGWVLNGAKIWITSAEQARYGVVFARTGPLEGRHRTITAFIVEPGTPGYRSTPIPVIRPNLPSELLFEDCYIPDDQRLGDVGKGFALAAKWLTKGRIPYAARCIGLAVAAMRLAIPYVASRSTFGKPLGSRQAIQWMLADSEIELRAARWLIWQAAWKADREEDFRVEASVAKVYASEAAGRVVDRVIQIFGGMGVAKAMPLERWYRELRVMRIGEGPSEIHRMVVARDLLRAYPGLVD